jgi:hypothetical protein
MRVKASMAGALVSLGEVEYLNKTVFLNYYTGEKHSRAIKRQEAKKARPQTNNPYSHIKTLGKLAQAERAIMKAVGPRQTAIEALYKELDAETKEAKRATISTRLGKKLDDQQKSESKLGQIAERRSLLERENKAIVEKGRKAKAKTSDSAEKSQSPKNKLAASDRNEKPGLPEGEN